MKLLIINNLHSGLRDGSIFDFMRKISADGDELVMRSTDGKTPIDTLLNDAANFDMVVAAGGDGTIAAVCYALRFSQIPILPFPAGTSNLLSMNLDQPEEPQALVDMVKSGYYLDFDLGEMTYSEDGNPTSKGFMITGGAGFDATIMENSESLKEAFGSNAYFFSALSGPDPTLAEFKVFLDDEVVNATGIAVLAMNFSKIQPDISITHGNDARDGLLEVVILKQRSKIGLLPAIVSAFLDREGHFPHRTEALGTYKSKYVRVESNPPLNLQYDGEPKWCQTPFEARILPGAARLIVTKQLYERLSQEVAD